MDDVEVDGPVSVDDAVAHPDPLAPRHLRVLGAQALGQLIHGLPDDGQVPQQRISRVWTGCEVLDARRVAMSVARCAALMISSRSRASHRIDDLRLGEHRAPQPCVQRPT